MAVDVWQNTETDVWEDTLTDVWEDTTDEGVTPFGKHTGLLLKVYP